MNKRKKVAIILIYLQNNLGDDLFLEHICLRYKHVDFYVAKNGVSNETFEKLDNLYFSDKMKEYFKEFELPELSAKAKKFYQEFDACVILGGSIFMQYNQQWRSKLLNFKRRALVNKNTYVIGANFGPYTDAAFLTEHTNAFKQINDVCFRDSYSASHFPGVKNVRYTPDILFSYKHNIPEQRNHIAISVIHCAFEGRPTKQFYKLLKYHNAYIDKMVEICTQCYHRGIDVSLLSFCEYQYDHLTAKTIESRCLMNGVTNVKVCHYDGEVTEVLDELASAKAVIATRFHAMILGFVFGKPVFPLIYDDKQKNVLQDLNFFGLTSRVEDVEGIDSNELLDSLLDSDGANSFDKIRPSVERAILASEKQFAGLDKILKKD